MKAYELLEKLEAWTKGCYAKRKDGTAIPIASTEAFCFCASGAIQKAYGVDAGKYLHRLAMSVGNIAHWNDAPERTHAEVVTKLKELDI